MLFKIELHNTIYNKQTLKTIYKFRNSTSLLIHYCGRIYPYKTFIELPSIKKKIYRYEVSDDSSPEERSLSDDIKKIKTLDSPLLEKPSIIKNNSTMNSIELIKLAASIIKPFAGNVDELDAFIQNVALINSMVTAETANFFLQFVRGRLTGKANVVCRNASSIDDIVTRLKSSIRRDPSDVVEARLFSIPFKNLSDFCDELEVTADKYLDALMNEGIPEAAATNMAIQKLVSICRRVARNDMVKAVIAASSYSAPKDVILKLRSEIGALNQDRYLNRNMTSYRGPQNNRFQNGRPFQTNNMNSAYRPNFRPPDRNSNFNSQRRDFVRTVQEIQPESENDQPTMRWSSEDQQ